MPDVYWAGIGRRRAPYKGNGIFRYVQLRSDVGGKGEEEMRWLMRRGRPFIYLRIGVGPRRSTTRAMHRGVLDIEERTALEVLPIQDSVLPHSALRVRGVGAQ